MHQSSAEVSVLEPFVGEWNMEALFPAAQPTDARARTVFEWLPGERFLIQRWEVDHPAAPDGIAVIGFDEGRGVFLQHYFDSRGVARIYEMTVEDGVWRLSRTTEDFSPLDFCQRFEGTFTNSGTVIRGRWETSKDGTNWEHDFELIYTKLA